MWIDNLTIIISKDIKQNNQKNYNANLTTLPNDLNVLERNFEQLSLILLFQVHVRNHIRSFPWMTSHYCRKDAPQKWFPNPNPMRMYNLIYLEAEDPEVL